MAAMTKSTATLPTGQILVWMAWRRYLLRLRASRPAAYEAVEEVAWAQLCEELDALGLHVDGRVRALAA